MQFGELISEKEVVRRYQPSKLKKVLVENISHRAIHEVKASTAGAVLYVMERYLQRKSPIYNRQAFAGGWPYLRTSYVKRVPRYADDLASLPSLQF